MGLIFWNLNQIAIFSTLSSTSFIGGLIIEPAGRIGFVGRVSYWGGQVGSNWPTLTRTVQLVWVAVRIWVDPYSTRIHTDWSVQDGPEMTSSRVKSQDELGRDKFNPTSLLFLLNPTFLFEAARGENYRMISILMFFFFTTTAEMRRCGRVEPLCIRILAPTDQPASTHTHTHTHTHI